MEIPVGKRVSFGTLFNVYYKTKDEDTHIWLDNIAKEFCWNYCR